MTNEEILKIALAYGFRDRPQGDGTIGLNAYVYEFARAMFEAGRKQERKEIIRLADDMEVESTEYCMNIYEEGEKYKHDLMNAIRARSQQ